MDRRERPDQPWFRRTRVAVLAVGAVALVLAAFTVQPIVSGPIRDLLQDRTWRVTSAVYLDGDGADTIVVGWMRDDARTRQGPIAIELLDAETGERIWRHESPRRGDEYSLWRSDPLFVLAATPDAIVAAAGDDLIVHDADGAVQAEFPGLARSVGGDYGISNDGGAFVWLDGDRVESIGLERLARVTVYDAVADAAAAMTGTSPDARSVFQAAVDARPADQGFRPHPVPVDDHGPTIYWGDEALVDGPDGRTLGVLVEAVAGRDGTPGEGWIIELGPHSAFCDGRVVNGEIVTVVAVAPGDVDHRIAVARTDPATGDTRWDPAFGGAP